MSLKNDILALWAKCSNEAERSAVLSEIESARHEIAIEYLWAEPALMKAIAELESSLTSIMRGSYSIASTNNFRHDGNGREAPLVGKAGYIAMLLAMRAYHRDRMHAELSDWGSHANRLQDAIEQKHHCAKPIDGCTSYVYEADPLTVECRICKAPKGVKCYMVPKAKDEHS